MSSVISPKKYADLLAETLPRAITSAEEHQRRVEELEALASRSGLSAEEETLLELLVALIEQYEARVAPLPDSPPDRMLRHFMEQQDVSENDLLVIFGDERSVLDVISGQRKISAAEAKMLAAKFHAPVACFL